MSLAERIERQEVVREQLQRVNQARRDAERKAQEQATKQEIEAQQAEQKRLEAQQTQLEKELAELESQQIQDTDRQRQLDLARLEISKKYQDQIDALIKSRQEYATIGGRPNKNASQSIIRNINGQIEVLRAQQAQAISLFDFSAKYPGGSITANELKQLREAGNVKSLLAIHEETLLKQEMQAQAARETSIRQAESERSIAQEKLDYTIRGFETSRAEKAKQDAIREKEIRQIKNLTQAETGKYQITKDYSIESRQDKKLAEPFKDLPVVTPESIYGTTQARSQKAVATFEETERQQKELERQIRMSSGKAEADKLKSEFQKTNPYVGTPNIYKYKGKTLATQGVTIEKELNTAIEDFGKITKDQPQPQKQTTKDITVSLSETLNISENLGGSKITNPTAVTIPTVLVEDKSGKGREPDITEMWQLAKQNLELSQIDFTPSKTDLELAKYEKENLAEITAFEKSGKAKTSGNTKPLVNTDQDTFNAGFVGYFNEFGDMARGAETKKPSLETLAVSDVTNLAEATMTKKPLPSSSQLSQTIKEKIQTPEGQAWLAGSAIAAGLANAVTFGGSGLIKGSSLALKITSIATKKTAKEAEQIAIKLSSKKIDENYIKERESEIAKDLRKRFPDLPEEKITQLSKSIATPKEERTVIEQFKNVAPKLTSQEAREIIKRNTQVPYTIDIIDKNTALIVTGSETSDLNRVVLFSRKAKESQIFLVPKDQTVTYKSILARAARDDTKQIAGIIRKENPNITKEDLQKQISQISQNLEQGKIIITAKQARLAQKEKPLIKETKESVSIGEKKYRVVKGTTNPEYEKITIGRYKATAKNINLIEKGSEYSILGVEKLVRTKDLKSFPQQVLESIENSKDLLGNIVVERLPAKAAKAASAAKKETRPPKPGKPFSTDNISITTDKNKIEITTTKKGSNASAKSETKKLADDYQKLADTAKAQIKPAKDIGKEITISARASKVSLDSSIGYKSTTRQTTQQEQKTESLLKFRVIQGQSLRSDLLEISKVIPDTKQIDLIKTGLDTSIRTGQKEDLAGLYSLLVEKGLKASELEKLKLKITEKQKLVTEFGKPAPTKAPPRTETGMPRNQPKPIPIGAKLKKELKDATKKKGKLFFRWNVNELSPGFYLPTKELTTGRTTKAVKKVERIQAKVGRRKINWNLNLK